MLIYAQESPGRIHKWKLRMVVSGGDNERFWYFCFPFYTFLYSLKFLQEAIFTIFLAKRFLPKNQFIIKNFPSQRLLQCSHKSVTYEYIFPDIQRENSSPLSFPLLKLVCLPVSILSIPLTHIHTQSCYAPSQFTGHCFWYSSIPRH